MTYQIGIFVLYRFTPLGISNFLWSAYIHPLAATTWYCTWYQ